MSFRTKLNPTPVTNIFGVEHETSTVVQTSLLSKNRTEVLDRNGSFSPPLKTFLYVNFSFDFLRGSAVPSQLRGVKYCCLELSQGFLTKGFRSPPEPTVMGRADQPTGRGLVSTRSPTATNYVFKADVASVQSK